MFLLAVQFRSGDTVFGLKKRPKQAGNAAFNTILLKIYTIELFLSSRFINSFEKKRVPHRRNLGTTGKKTGPGRTSKPGNDSFVQEEPPRRSHGRNFFSQVRSGFAMVMRVPGSVEWVSHTLPPITDPFPITTAPRMVAPA